MVTPPSKEISIEVNLASDDPGEETKVSFTITKATIMAIVTAIIAYCTI